LERLKDRETPDRSPSDAAIERSRGDETGRFLFPACIKIIRNSKYLLRRRGRRVNLGVTSRRRFEGSKCDQFSRTSASFFRSPSATGGGGRERGARVLAEWQP
jgi:hypothetical protein